MLQFTTIEAEVGKFLKRWGEAVKIKLGFFSGLSSS